MESISNYADYGVSTSGASLTMEMFNPTGGVASPRLYLLAEDKKKYEMLQLTGNELAFDVDVSKLPCGMNGALYLSEMEAEGGRSALNPGGATYGTGYCDAQCFVTPWVNGVVSTIKTIYSTLNSHNIGQHRWLRSLLQRDGYLGSQCTRDPDRTPYLQQARSLQVHWR